MTTELERLKRENEKLQKQYDELLRTHILHQLVAMELSGIRPRFEELH